MNIRARLTNVGLHALASSLIVSGLLPMRVLAADSVGGFPPLSYTTKHAADAATQTIRMTSSASVDSAITSITAIAPNSFSPVEVDGEPSCENPLYATLCQEIKESNDGWETIYSGSGTTSQTIYGAYTHWRATVSYVLSLKYTSVGTSPDPHYNSLYTIELEGQYGQNLAFEEKTLAHEDGGNPYWSSITYSVPMGDSVTLSRQAGRRITPPNEFGQYCSRFYGTGWIPDSCKDVYENFYFNDVKLLSLKVYR
ncbi:hypothetical protein KW459_16140 [Vibrio fluvialis]|nr:hypothetical protein [Vibrio fluvialis]